MFLLRVILTTTIQLSVRAVRVIALFVPQLLHASHASLSFSSEAISVSQLALKDSMEMKKQRSVPLVLTTV